MNTTSFLDTRLKEISEKVKNQTEELAKQRFDADRNTYTITQNVSLHTWRVNLITIFACSIVEDIEKTYDSLKEWGSKAVNLLVNMNLPLDVAIEEIRFYRNTIGELIKNESIRQDLRLQDFYEIISRFDSVVDRAVHWLSISYSNSYSSRITAAETTAMELSIPIVRVTEHIGILPLVGDIDTKRSQQLMEKALHCGTSLSLTYIVLDLSGVPIIDTMVANHIFKVLDALKLVGIKAVLTGIRPEIAQTMVNLGLDVKGISTFASLHQAIKKLNLTSQQKEDLSINI
ncbi:STAS domain-containing protein [Peribacillus sp. SCS-155]|uniref:STAS domain-containing protein n=1 Tax=Peribacillus sedimenti TaxID=3115297 RepID=UPI00390590C1